MGISKGYVSEPCSCCHLCNLPCPQTNILINNGCACLTDFGLLTIVSGQSTDVSSLVEGGMVQWMSPELLAPEDFGLMESHPTKESDCYALGMVVYEVLGGQTPFTPLESSITRGVLGGLRPERPQGKGGALFTDELWKILGLCWRHKPEERTNAKVVLQCLEGTPLLPRPVFDTDDGYSLVANSSVVLCCSESGMPLHFAEGLRLTFGYSCGIVYPSMSPHMVHSHPMVHKEGYSFQVPPEAYEDESDEAEGEEGPCSCCRCCCRCCFPCCHNNCVIM